MKHWITIHWPLTLEMPRDMPHQGVWVRNEKEHVVTGMEPGDLVLIYETKDGRTVIKRDVAGNETRSRYRKGAMGIVALVRVRSRLEDIGVEGWEEYIGGKKTWWRYHAETEPVSSAGFVPMDKTREILGFEPATSLRFGDTSGMRELSKSEFEALWMEFRSETNTSDIETLEMSRTLPQGHPKGEGPIHKKLKAMVADDPSGLLEEEGLTHWQTEHRFPTGDRVDVVLKDKHGEFIAVEVEVDCDRNEVAGPLQCMKYGALLTYQYNRREKEVRRWLVARSIHPVVRKKCEKYGIRFTEVTGV